MHRRLRLRQPEAIPVLAPTVQAVVFDAVGTLLSPDPPAPVVYADVGRKFGSRLSQDKIVERFRAAFREEEEFDRRHHLRTSEEREIRRWRSIVGRVLDDVTNPEACFQELFEWFSRPEAWCCPPDAGPTLAELAHRGFLLALASNYDSRLRRVVAGWPVLHPLRSLVVSSEVGWRKPAPEFFTALEQTLGLSAGQILHVGDDPVNDVAGGQAAGLQTVLFDPTGKEPSLAGKRINCLSNLLGLVVGSKRKK